jgi:hypothetical protein
MKKATKHRASSSSPLAVVARGGRLLLIYNAFNATPKTRPCPSFSVGCGRLPELGPSLRPHSIHSFALNLNTCFFMVVTISAVSPPGGARLRTPGHHRRRRSKLGSNLLASNSKKEDLLFFDGALNSSSSTSLFLLFFRRLLLLLLVPLSVLLFPLLFFLRGGRRKRGRQSGRSEPPRSQPGSFRSSPPVHVAACLGGEFQRGRLAILLSRDVGRRRSVTRGLVHVAAGALTRSSRERGRVAILSRDVGRRRSLIIRIVQVAGRLDEKLERGCLALPSSDVGRRNNNYMSVH